MKAVKKKRFTYQLYTEWEARILQIDIKKTSLELRSLFRGRWITNFKEVAVFWVVSNGNDLKQRANTDTH